MALRPLKPSTFILIYFYHRLFNDVSFGFILSILSPLTGLDWCDSGLFMALRSSSHLSPQLLYWCISVTVFLTNCLFIIFSQLLYCYISVTFFFLNCLFVLFCQFYPRLLVLNDVTRDYLWHPATLALSALTYFINISFFHICPDSAFVFVNLNLSRLPHLTDVTVANGKWQCTFLTFCFFRESPWWWDSWELNFQRDLKINYVLFSFISPFPRTISGAGGWRGGPRVIWGQITLYCEKIGRGGRVL